MSPQHRLPTRQRPAQKQAKIFDPKAFLANGIGRTVLRYSPKQAIFSQGEHTDAVYYIQQGRVRLSVTSKQGQGSNHRAAQSRRFLGGGVPCLRSTRPHGNRYCAYGLLYLED